MTGVARSPSVVAAGALNLCCALAHLLFEAVLFRDTSAYREFLLVENLLIALVFALLGGGLLLGDEGRRRLTLHANLGFWGVFLVAVAAFRPPVTTMEPVKAWLPVPQGVVLLGTGALALGLSVAAMVRSRGQSAHGVE